MLLRILGLLSVLTLTSCAIVPDAIEVEEGTQLVSYSRAVTTGNEMVGETARWGGIIVGVENKPQKTYVEIVHFPLNNYGKPNTSAETVGRFKAMIDGFVDPIVFEEGRTVTFVGNLIAPTSGMVGEQPYMYPTVQAVDYHLWRKETTYDVSGLYFNYRTGWYSPFFYPYYRTGWGFYNSRVRVIQRGNAAPKAPVRGTNRSYNPSRSSNHNTTPAPRQNNRKSIER